MSRQHIQVIERKAQDRKIAERNVNRSARQAYSYVKGLPTYKTDRKSVYALASSMLSAEDIGLVLGISGDTVIRRFGDIVEKARGHTKSKLAKAMLNKALEQNDGRMQVWLSKQHLGYKEAWPDNVQPIAIQINIQDVPT